MLDDWQPDSDCKRCNADGGWHWTNSEGERMWITCDCWRRVGATKTAATKPRPVLRLIKGDKR